MNPIINIFEDISKKEPFIKQQYDALNKKKIKTSLNEIPFEELINGLKVADPISNKSGGKKTPYVNLLVKWLRNNSIKFPEDTEKCASLFNKVSFLKTKGSSLNPDSFNSFGDLYKAVSEEEKKFGDEEAPKTKWEKYAPVVFESGPYKLLKVDDYETQGKELFSNSGWCVAHASHFNNYKPPFYLVLKNEERYCLIHENSGQIKDINDNPINKFEQALDKDLYRIIGKFNDDVTEDDDMISDEGGRYNEFLKDPVHSQHRLLIEEYIDYLNYCDMESKLSDYFLKVFNEKNLTAITIIFRKYIANTRLSPEIIEYYIKTNIDNFMMMRILFDSLTDENILAKISIETFNNVAKIFGNKIIKSPDSPFKDICYKFIIDFTSYLTKDNANLLLSGRYTSGEAFRILNIFITRKHEDWKSKNFHYGELTLGENLFKYLNRADLGGIVEIVVNYNFEIPNVVINRLSDDPDLVIGICNLLKKHNTEIPDELKSLLPKETNLKEMVNRIFYRNFHVR
jgi:hypothetical protein